MIAQENILTQITRLLETGSTPRSSCSAGLLQKLKPLLEGGVIIEERSGAGRRLIVRDPEALRQFRQVHYPELVSPEDLPSRIAGVARFRDSKAFPSNTPEIVSVRAWSETALLHGSLPTEATTLTERHGVFSFLIGGSPAREAYKLSGPCALVENPIVFTQFEKLRLPVGLALYGRGKLSTRLLDWLSGMSAGFTLVHLPDYDPAGLMEFERLRQSLGERVRLHLPEDLEQQFERFSKPALLNNPASRAMLATLRKSTQLDTRRVVALIDRHNAGLEQESLLARL